MIKRPRDVDEASPRARLLFDTPRTAAATGKVRRGRLDGGEKQRPGMMDTEQIFQEIRSLPTDAQRTLIERIVRELGGATSEPTRRARPADDPFLGLLADEPELADEIHQIATKERHEGREAFNGDENPS
jgi:hypothetical protein